MLLLVAGSTLGLVWPSIASLLFFVPPFHMYRQLKGTYGLGRRGAMWRTTLLVGFAFAAVGLFTALIVGVGEVEGLTLTGVFDLKDPSHCLGHVDPPPVRFRDGRQAGN